MTESFPDQQTAPKTYWAFISYSSRDRKWGKWLHKRLENYLIPSEYQGLKLADGAELGKHIRPVFRDRDELSGSSELGAVIEEALTRSRFLIVLCSPNSAASNWVNKEIEDFRAIHGDGKVLALILDGEPNASTNPNTDDALECFPPALRYPLEPLAGDLRTEADGKERGFLKILAGMADIGFDDLYRRHERAERKRRLVLGVVASVVIAALTGLSIFAFNQKSIAETQTSIASREKERADVERDLAIENEKRATAAETKAENEATRAQKSEAGAKFQLAHARWNSKRVLEARDLMEQIPEEYRELEWFLTKRRFEGSYLTLYQHRDAVSSTVYSPDGDLIASSSRDKTIKIWNAKTGQLIRTLAGHTDWVLSSVFSPDGRYIASSSNDKTIKIWDVKNGKEVRSLTGHAGSVTSVAFSSDGKQLASASWDKTVKIWNAESGSEIRTLTDHAQSVLSVAFSPDDRLIASGSVGTTKIWEAKTGKELKQFDKGTSPHEAVSFSPDGRYLASANWDGLMVWNVDTGKEERFFINQKSALAFSPDGRFIATTGEDNVINLTDLKSWKGIQTFTGHTGLVRSISFSPDCSQVVSCSNDKTVKVWDVKPCTSQLLTDSLSQNVSLNSLTGNIAFSPDGKYLAAGFDSKAGTAMIWDAATGQQSQLLAGHTQGIRSVAFHPDGHLLASASTDGTVKIWDAQSGLEVESFSGHGDGINTIAYSPDGSFLASGSGEKTIKIWNANTGKVIHTLSGHTDEIESVAFSSDGRLLASGSSDTNVKIWDVNTGQEIQTFVAHDEGVLSVAFCPESNRLATTGWENTVKIWEPKTGKKLQSLSGHTSFVQSVTFNRDGSRIASASSDGFLKIWDAKTGEELISLFGYIKGVYCAVFSHNGERIASLGSDNTIRIWLAPSEMQVKTLYEHSDQIERVSFSADGDTILSKDMSNQRIAWDLKSGTEINSATWGEQDFVFGDQVSPDGRWFATSNGNRVQLVDLKFKDVPRENGYRISKSRFDPSWHQKQVNECVRAQDWFAGTYHCAWLIKNDPENQKYHMGFLNCRKMQAFKSKQDGRDFELHLPLLLKDAIERLPENESPSANDEETN